MANIQFYAREYFTKELLNEILYYNGGCLFWRIDIGKKIKAGTRAGCVNSKKGYRRVLYNRTRISEHRAIWVLHYGSIPEGLEVDHIDTDKTNNLLSNLRLVTSAQNKWNKLVRKDSLSGYKGVCKCKNRWRASIRINSKAINLGSFLTVELAHEAYKAAAVKYHGQFANFGGIQQKV